MSVDAAPLRASHPGRRLSSTGLYAPAAAILFGLVSYVYLRHAIGLAAEAPYWMDEVLAVWTARLPSVAAIWSALLGGAEFSPPGYHLLLHGIILAGGTGPLAMRLPSILAVYLAALAVALIVRRRSGWPVAAVAATIVLASGIFSYAVQARPYAVVTAAVAWAAVMWDAIEKDDRAGWRIPTLSIMLATAVALHFYAVLLVALFGLAELLRTIACRAIRPRVVAAITIAGATVLVWWPIMRAVSSFNSGDVWAEFYYARPTLTGMLLTYWQLLASLAVPILALLVLLLVHAMVGRTSPLERRLSTLAGLFCAVPVIVLIVAIAVSHTYNDRYAISAVLGFALLAAALIGTLEASADLAAVFMLVALITCSDTISGGEIARPERRQALGTLLVAPADLPIATGDGLRFLEMSEGLPPTTASRLVYLRLPASSASGDPTNQHQVERWAAMRPDLAVVSASEFLCRTPRFLLFSDKAGGWDDIPSWISAHAKISPTQDAALSLVTPQPCPAS